MVGAVVRWESDSEIFQIFSRTPTGAAKQRQTSSAFSALRALAKLIIAALSLLAAFAIQPTAFANDEAAEPSNQKPSEEAKLDRHNEVWADAGENYWLVYSGSTLAPFSDIHQNGLRIRFVGGYGHYSYQIVKETKPTENYDAQVSFGDALIGYLWRLDPLILKLFVGASFADHKIAPYDANSTTNGMDWGVKGVAEFWFNIGTNAFASVDLAWAQAHNTRSARARLGYKPFSNFSIGPEAGINIDRQGDYKIYQEDPNYRAKAIDYGRVGLFARYEWYGGELSASAGLIGDFRQRQSAYGTVNWITQY